MHAPPKIPFYLIAFAVFPVLSLYTVNIDKVQFTDVLVPLILNVFIALFAWKIFYILLHKDTALQISVFFLLFYSYSIFPSLISKIVVLWDKSLARYAWAFFETTRVNLALIAGLVVLGYLIVRLITHIGKKHNLVKGMNLICFGLLVSTVVFIPSRKGTLTTPPLPTDDISFSWLDDLNQENQPLYPPDHYSPDIYIIFLDGYGRQDILKEEFNFDNTAFLTHLRERGFYIADESHSNYGITYFSIASMLNYTYLDSLEDLLPQGFSTTRLIANTISFNRTFSQFRNLGYKTIAFSSDFNITNNRNVDLFLKPPFSFNDFHQTLINNTPLSLLSKQQYDLHRQEILFEFDSLPKIALDPDPTITYLHVFAPHPPFVFDENGKPVNASHNFSILDANDFLIIGTEQEYLEGYRGQVIYITSLIQDAIDQILATSPQEPIIIVQGDHGSRLYFSFDTPDATDPNESFSILNAYFLPQNRTQQLYPSISPVNSMRVILNAYFGTNYPLLEDRSYFLPRDSIYQHIDITDRLAP